MFKYRLAVSSVMSLLKEPLNPTAVMRFVDSTVDTWPMRAARQRMIRGLSPEQLALLRELTDRAFDLAAMRALPENTLGHGYAVYLERGGLRQTIGVEVCPEIEKVVAADWVLRRYMKMHDMLHFLLGFSTEPPGEVGLQAFNLRNSREPYGLIGLAGMPVALLRYGAPLQTLRELARGWSWGAYLPNLFHAPLEEMLEMDITEARRRLGIDEALWRTAAS